MWIRWPIGKCFQTLSNFLISKNIKSFVSNSTTKENEIKLFLKIDFVFVIIYPVSFIIPISVFEKPHLGVFLSPFINIVTFPLFIKTFSLSSKLSVDFGASGIDAENVLHFVVNSTMLTPSIRSIAEPLRKNRTVGTASI